MVRPCIVAAIGNFDGVHRGHQQLLEKTAGFANAVGCVTGAVVFEPHPRRYFRPDDPPFLLTLAAQRERLLRAHGAIEVITLRFDARLAAMAPGDFVRDVLKQELNLSGVVTGTDFRFGKGRSGDVAALQSSSEAIGMKAFLVAPEQAAGGQKIGSSAIRAALKEGDVRSAAAMLGRLWETEGTVFRGQQLGRTLGFPTANMSLGGLIEPREGVYAVQVVVDANTYGGVANFGRRPTVGESTPLLEAHVLDFDGDLYGKALRVRFVDFIRNERKFDSLDALRAQIAVDCNRARSLLSHQ